MALCIMSKCRGAGLQGEATFLHSQEGGNEEGVEWRGVGWAERDSGKGVGGAARGHYGFMHNVEMSGSGF